MTVKQNKTKLNPPLFLCSSSPMLGWDQLSLCLLIPLFCIFLPCCQMCKELVYPCHTSISILPRHSSNYCGKVLCSLQVGIFLFQFQGLHFKCQDQTEIFTRYLATLHLAVCKEAGQLVQRWSYFPSSLSLDL